MKDHSGRIKKATPLKVPATQMLNHICEDHEFEFMKKNLFSLSKWLHHLASQKYIHSVLKAWFSVVENSGEHSPAKA